MYGYIITSGHVLWLCPGMFQALATPLHLLLHTTDTEFSSSGHDTREKKLYNKEHEKSIVKSNFKNATIIMYI